MLVSHMLSCVLQFIKAAGGINGDATTATMMISATYLLFYYEYKRS